jgi:hypothetical protein
LPANVRLTNTITYCITESITAVKDIMIKGPGVTRINHLPVSAGRWAAWFPDMF